MQHCNRIYFSTVHWRFNMFPAAYRSSSGALTVFAASGLHTQVVTGCNQVWVGTGQQFPLRLDYGRSTLAYVNQRLQIQLELLMMSGMPLETCWAFNERWNNKFYYKVASCWLLLLNLNDFAFSAKLWKPVKAVTRHLLSVTSSEDSWNFHTERGFEVINFGQITLEGSQPLHLPLFLVTIPRVLNSLRNIQTYKFWSAAQSLEWERQSIYCIMCMVFRI